jgi:hypothetical protein
MKQAPLLLMFALHAFTNLLPVHIFNYQLLYHIGSFGLVGWLDGRFFFFVFFLQYPRLDRCFIWDGEVLR